MNVWVRSPSGASTAGIDAAYSRTNPAAVMPASLYVKPTRGLPLAAAVSLRWWTSAHTARPPPLTHPDTIRPTSSAVGGRTDIRSSHSPTVWLPQNDHNTVITVKVSAVRAASVSA